MRNLKQHTHDPKSLLCKCHANWISIALYTKMTSSQVYFSKKQFSLLKSVKQHISYFSQLPKNPLTLYKNLHGNMLLIFILMNFLRKHHLLKDKQEDLTPIKFTASLVFFVASMSIQTQQNLNHNFCTYQAQVMHFSR